MSWATFARVPSARSSRRVAALLLAVGLACSAPEAPREEEPPGPNVLWIVWDTVRADRLGLYGAKAKTTPQLERWAQQARVFENALATASSTVPTHAAMFTGKLPTEHGASNEHQWLDDGHETIAELFRAAGYQTYLWAANPHISSEENFQQGFEVEQHPWDPDTRSQALEIVRAKVAEDSGSGLAQRLHGEIKSWALKAAGELAQQGLLEWLEARDPARPYFAFVNYMDAHRPYVPSRRYRARLMTPEQVERSYRLDHSWRPYWSYTFGLSEYSDEELALMRATYDAALLELDDLFGRLLASLRTRGLLDDTVVVLTADHGEQLGEHHMLDHQYTLYRPVLNVPLVLYYPARIEPGRDSRPVMNFDLFPTLLELAGIEPPQGLASKAVSLLDPRSARVRLAEYPAAFARPFEQVARAHPGFDPAPWRRRLRALHEDGYKLIWGEDGRHELYHVRADPDEARNLWSQEPERAQRMLAQLDAVVASLAPARPGGGPAPSVAREHREMLEALGYAVESERSPARREDGE